MVAGENQLRSQCPKDSATNYDCTIWQQYGDAFQAGALGCASGLLSCCGQDVLCLAHSDADGFLFSTPQPEKVQAVLRRSANLRYRPATLKTTIAERRRKQSGVVGHVCLVSDISLIGRCPAIFNLRRYSDRRGNTRRHDLLIAKLVILCGALCREEPALSAADGTCATGRELHRSFASLRTTKAGMAKVIQL
jgi:hypothetical protein